MTARWTPQDSDDLDRLIRAMRKPTPNTAQPKTARRGVQTSDSDGLPRGEVTPEELRRRKQVESAMQRRANKAKREEQ